jgi:hypothetical protein
MPYFPLPQASPRPPRTEFSETTPAVLRCGDGRRLRGKVQIISLTGGLLCLSQSVEQGSQVKLMFLTCRGSVMGAAEMLSPISWGLQPFKFVRLHDGDEARLQAAIKLSLDQNRVGHGQMERYRAW